MTVSFLSGYPPAEYAEHLTNLLDCVVRPDLQRKIMEAVRKEVSEEAALRAATGFASSIRACKMSIISVGMSNTLLAGHTSFRVRYDFDGHNEEIVLHI